jgi:hypothetical protein
MPARLYAPHAWCVCCRQPTSLDHTDADHFPLCAHCYAYSRTGGAQLSARLDALTSEIARLSAAADFALHAIEAGEDDQACAALHVALESGSEGPCGDT